MSHDPFAQIDQNVLDLIEHSPEGAVPHTPTYQDALARLKAAHQVYGSADHRDGYVTVRSLAKLPVFFADNLEGYLGGTVTETDLESDGSIFDRYVQSRPSERQREAEGFRQLVVAKKTQHRSKHGEVAHDPVHSLIMLPGSGPNPGLPGDYLVGSVAEEVGGGWLLQMHDRIDGAASRHVQTQAEALEALQDLVASAPFLLSELESLGFTLN
jgi:hypothetical protein